MSLTVAEVRQRVAAALGALPEWTESRYTLDNFGADTRSISQHAFVVGAPSTELADAERRQVLPQGALVVTRLVVRFLHQVRADRQVGDADDGTDAEQLAIQTVLAIPRTDLHIVLDAAMASREVAGDGTWMIHTLTFRAIHQFALQA